MGTWADGVRGSVTLPVAGGIACVLLCVVAGGCAENPVMHLRTTAEFEQVVLRGDKPVLVNFYKGGCPTCIPVDGIMDTLAGEYKGRILIAKFMLMQPYSAVTSPELKEKYDISYYPVVILFVNGRETCRFFRNYHIEEYRKAMDDILLAPTTQKISLDGDDPSSLQDKAQ